MKPLSFPLAITFLLFALAGFTSGETLVVTDTKGRTIAINLLTLSAKDEVEFTVPEKGKKEHTLAIRFFNEESQAKIRESAKNLKPRYPKVEIEAVIGKRRKRTSYSYYTQAVTAKIKIENESMKLKFPKSSARIVFLGKSQGRSSFYRVLSVEDFEVSIPAGKTFEFEAKDFSTRYSDYNYDYDDYYGGYQYDGYILAIMDSDRKVVEYKASDPGVRSILEKDLLLISKVIDYKVNAVAVKDLTLAPPNLKVPYAYD